MNASSSLHVQSFLFFFQTGGLLHCDLSLYNPHYPPHTRGYSTWSQYRDRLLPLPSLGETGGNCCKLYQSSATLELYISLLFVRESLGGFTFILLCAYSAPLKCIYSWFNKNGKGVDFLLNGREELSPEPLAINISFLRCIQRHEIELIITKLSRSHVKSAARRNVCKSKLLISLPVCFMSENKKNY